jgi:hypothetical protein
MMTHHSVGLPLTILAIIIKRGPRDYSWPFMILIAPAFITVFFPHPEILATACWGRDSALSKMPIRSPHVCNAIANAVRSVVEINEF